MPKYTYEGFTKTPVHPTTVIVDFGTGNLPVDTNVNWGTYAMTGLTPTIEDEVLNSFPVKFSASGTVMTIQPGVWEVSIQYIMEETGAANAEVGFAMTSSAAEALFLMDLALTNDHIRASSMYSGEKRGIMKVESVKDFKFIARERSGVGTLNVKRLKIVFQRLCNYEAGTL